MINVSWNRTFKLAKNQSETHSQKYATIVFISIARVQTNAVLKVKCIFVYDTHGLNSRAVKN